MFTSATEDQKSYITKNAFIYLLISLFCTLFGAVYEKFSHEVYSAYMIYAFLFPLAGGALPFFALSLFSGRHLPGRLPVNLYNSGIAALTVGSFFQGALEIYGTTNALVRIYWVAGFGFLCLGILSYFIGFLCFRRG